MAEPFCAHTRHILSESCSQLGHKFLPTGTVVTIEGPRFSTKAESKLFQNWNCDVINMTTVPEVTLATELGMSYAVLALPTDYDCWRDGTESVTVEKVLEIMKINGTKAKEVIVRGIGLLKESDWLPVSEKNRRRAAMSSCDAIIRTNLYTYFHTFVCSMLAIMSLIYRAMRVPQFVPHFRALSNAGRDPPAGSIREGGGKFGEIEAAEENVYFKKMEAEQLRQLKQLREESASHIQEEIAKGEERVAVLKRRLKEHKKETSHLEKKT